MPISLSGLTKRFTGPNVLTEVTTSFPENDISVVIGKNGSGKSTLLNCVAGLLEFESGSVSVGVDPIHYELDSAKKTIPFESRRRMGYIFQNKSLWPHFTAMRNITHPLTKVQGLTQKNAVIRAQEYLDLLELGSAHYNKYPSELSGGEQRKLAIARTLASEPCLLLVDELEANLDQSALRLTLNIIKQKYIKVGRTVLIVSHSVDLLDEFMPHIVLLGEGRVLESAKGVKTLLTKNQGSPETRRIVKESVDPSSSKWFLANQSLEAAIRISQVNVDEPDLSSLLTRIGQEISALVAKFDEDAEHLLLIATKHSNGSGHAEVRIRSAHKTPSFVLDGRHVTRLGSVVEQKGVVEGSAIYDFGDNYLEEFHQSNGVPLRKRAKKAHSSLIDMMFDSKAVPLEYKSTSRHPPITGAYRIEIPIPEKHDLELESYYEFSKETAGVYLIGCRVDDEVRGIISIDTYSKERWSDFVVQQLILVGNMVAIAIKNHDAEAARAHPVP